MTAIPKEIQQIVRASKGQPVRLTDPKTHVEYIVLPAEIFDRMQLYDDTPLRDDEMQKPAHQSGTACRMGRRGNGYLQ